MDTERIVFIVINIKSKPGFPYLREELLEFLQKLGEMQRFLKHIKIT